MMATQAGLFDEIDWTRPWLAPYRSLAAPIIQAADWRVALNEHAATMGIANHRGLPIHFVPQASLPHGVAYEAFISATGGVPTRENLHDFFNALVWLSFPRVKVQLNALQAAEIEKVAKCEINPAGSHVRRGRVRDAATIFDENAALLVVSDEGLIEKFRSHRWHEIFVSQRYVFDGECEVWLFGHALMEKLVRPYKAITAHAWPVIASKSFFSRDRAEKQAWMDEMVARHLERGLSTSDFTPLPVLGIPGWSQGQDASFYADAGVFRPKRQVILG